jgi:hypothetical protein
MSYPAALLNSARCGYQLTCAIAQALTVPEGPGRELHAANVPGYHYEHAGQPCGHVSYDEPLAPELISRFALVPLMELAAVNGQRYVESFLGYQFEHEVKTALQGLVHISSTCEGEREFLVCTYPELLLRMQEYKWQAADVI